MKSWLILRSGAPDPGRPFRKPLLISIPKKIEKRAVRRNRLKRLIREAVRSDDFFRQKGLVHRFRVISMPPLLSLAAVRESITKAKLAR